MKPRYRTNRSIGWCGDLRKDPSMGRSSIHRGDKNRSVKLYLSKIKRSVRSGAYDSNGTYFSAEDPIYWAASEDENVDFILRAVGRDNAKSLVIDQYPRAKFFR